MVRRRSHKKRHHHRRGSSSALVVRSAPRAASPIIIRETRGQKMRRYGRRVGHAALGEKHRLIAIAGGFALGMIDKSGVNIPTLPFLGKAGTLGLAAWVGGKFMHSQTLNDAATGFLAIAAYELAKDGAISGPGHYDPNYAAGY